MKWVFTLLILKFLIVHSLNNPASIDHDSEIYIDLLLSAQDHHTNRSVTAKSASLHMHLKKPDYQALYSFGLYTDYSNILTNEIVENYIQLALLKHFDCISNNIDVRLVGSGFTGQRRDKKIGIIFTPMKVSLTSSFKILSENVSSSLIDFSVNRRSCFVNETSGLIECERNGKLKDAESLLYFSVFWIKLDNTSNAFQRIYNPYGSLLNFNLFRLKTLNKI